VDLICHHLNIKKKNMNFDKLSCETRVNIICHYLNIKKKMSSWIIIFKSIHTFYQSFKLYLDSSSRLSYLMTTLVGLILNQVYTRNQVGRVQSWYVNSKSFLELKHFFLSSSISQNPANIKVVEKLEEMIFNLKINFRSFFYLKTSKYLK
jgi:hypothetical protein